MSENDVRLALLMERARNHRMTPREKFEQRVSFVYGQMGGAITKEEARRQLAESLGVDLDNI